VAEPATPADKSSGCLFEALWAVTALAIVTLVGFLWLHATVTNGWKEDLIDAGPIIALLVLAL